MGLHRPDAGRWRPATWGGYPPKPPGLPHAPSLSRKKQPYSRCAPKQHRRVSGSMASGPASFFLRFGGKKRPANADANLNKNLPFRFLRGDRGGCGGCVVAAGSGFGLCFSWGCFVSSCPFVCSGSGCSFVSSVGRRAWCWRSVAGSAVGSGAGGWCVRSSSRSFSGFVVVGAFGSFGAASGWAARWAARCGVPCVVRCRGGRAWSVSVPVAR